MRWIYAEALYQDPAATLDDLRLAVNTLEGTERTARRVFGGAHPMTVDIGRALQNARAALARAIVRLRASSPSSPPRSARIVTVERASRRPRPRLALVEYSRRHRRVAAPTTARVERARRDVENVRARSMRSIRVAASAMMRASSCAARHCATNSEI